MEAVNLLLGGDIHYSGKIVVPVIPIHSIELYVGGKCYDRLYLEKRGDDPVETMHSDYEYFTECQMHNYVPEPDQTLSVRLLDAKGNEIASPVSTSNVYWGRNNSGLRYEGMAPSSLTSISSATGMNYTISTSDTASNVGFTVTQTVPDENGDDVTRTFTAWVRRKVVAHHDENPDNAVCTLTTSDGTYADQKYDSIDCALRAAAFAGGTKTIKMVGDTNEYVELYDNIIFDLNGHTLTASSDEVGTGKTAFVLRGGSSLTLKDSSANKTGKIVGGSGSYEVDRESGSTGGCVNVADHAAFVMNGGTLTGGSATRGGAVMVKGSNAVFTMNAGTISGNTAVDGAGVYADIEISSDDYVSAGAFTMNGGEISNNEATKNGGGIFIGKTYKDMARMTGGSIRNNTAANGGGVYNEDTVSLIMSGGSIEGNTASHNGGGVCGSVVGSAVVVKNNTAGENGGGVYGYACDQYPSGKVTLTGNQAKIGGGGYGRLGSSVTVTGNSAEQAGGWYESRSRFPASQGTRWTR